MNKFNRILAVLFALAMVLSCAACGGSETVQEEPVYATIGDTAISSGVYNFMMFDAFNAVMDAHDVDYKKVYSLDIDGVSGEEYVRTQADKKFASYYTVNKLFGELGLTLDAYSEYMSKYYASAGFSSDGEMFAALGITEDDIVQAYNMDAKSTDIFNKIYGVGGQFEIPASVKQQKMTDSYYRVQYIYLSLMKDTVAVGDDANTTSEPLSEADAAAVRAKAQDYLDRYNAGEQFEDLVYDYEKSQAAADEETTRMADYQYDYYFGKTDTNAPAELLTALGTMKDGEAKLVEGDESGEAYILVLRRLPISGTDDENWQGYAMSLCQSDYAAEFTAYIEEQTKNTEIDYNEAARELYTTSYFMKRLKKYIFDAQVEALG